MPTYDVSPDCTIHYLEHNPQGHPPVLLLHGLGSCGEDWVLQVTPFTAAGYRLIAADARGFGRSSYPGGGLTVRQMAEDMARLLEGIQAAPAHVVGISMGGTLALQLALDHPDLVRRLVLVNTFARLRPRSLRGWAYVLLRGVLVHTLGLPTQARMVARRIFPKPEQAPYREVLYQRITQTNPAAYRAAMRALVRFDVMDRLGEVRAPTLVVTGSEDTTVPPEEQAHLVRGIPNVRQVVIEGGGHAVILDHAEAFNQAVLDFLGED